MCSTKKICWRLRIDADIKLHKNKTLFLNQQFRRKANYYYYQEKRNKKFQSKTGYETRNAKSPTQPMTL